ncbi:MAG TPA: hypothetical protein VFK38_03720 [Candidatus Limnocylindrales bacterium]|nr:hypothetical protein [Candidatus Limnocylindrales bacterium]
MPRTIRAALALLAVLALALAGALPALAEPSASAEPPGGAVSPDPDTEPTPYDGPRVTLTGTALDPAGQPFSVLSADWWTELDGGSFTVAADGSFSIEVPAPTTEVAFSVIGPVTRTVEQSGCLTEFALRFSGTVPLVLGGSGTPEPVALVATEEGVETCTTSPDPDEGTPDPWAGPLVPLTGSVLDDQAQPFEVVDAWVAVERVTRSFEVAADGSFSVDVPADRTTVHISVAGPVVRTAQVGDCQVSYGLVVRQEVPLTAVEGGLAPVALVATEGEISGVCGEAATPGGQAPGRGAGATPPETDAAAAPDARQTDSGFPFLLLGLAGMALLVLQARPRRSGR